MSSPSSLLLTRLKTRVSLWLPIILSTVVALALIAESSSALAVAQGEQNQQVQQEAEEQAAEQLDITDTADARQFAVDMLESNFPASRDAAAAALAGSEADFEAYKDGGLETAQNQDLRQILVTISAISGPKVQEKVTELLDANDGAGDTEAIAEFIDAGWQELQAQDDRATAWQAAEAPRGTALKRAADAALKDNSAEALAEFAATGADTARTHDKRREVYELSTSELPSVAAGAQEALRVNTDTAIDTFLRYGQFVAASQDAEKMNTSQLVNLAITEAKKASEANSLAVQQADNAARASENARRAAQKARDEAIAADKEQVKAGNAAKTAGELANQAARVADQAVAASQEARIALQQTADALARAAAAASQARAAAATAAARASDASRNAGDARAARIAAEQANSAAQAADLSQEAYRHANTAARHAGNAGAAASAAAGNAEAAAAAASEAAGAAGVSESAAAEARAGAARARAAAGRARAAANQVDQLVVRIQDLVNKARDAAKQAAEHARRSASAAEESAQYAGEAEYAARMSGKHAEDAAAAAKAADEAIDIAEAANEISRAVADDRAAAEKDFLRGEAEDARAAQDALDAAAREEDERRAELRKKLDSLGVDGPGMRGPREGVPGDEGEKEEAPDPREFTGDIATLREATVAAALVGGPNVAGAAQTALESGYDDDLKMFALSGYPAAVSADESQLLRDWWESDPNEDLRIESGEFANADAETVNWFVTERATELRTPGLREATWNLRETAGQRTISAADNALRSGTYEDLNEFVNEGGYEKARWSDQVKQAYDLAETGGPEVQAAAEAAVVGDRAGLNEFIVVEQYRRAAMDEQRVTHDANISSMLAVGRRAADLAGEFAANAQAAHENALGSASRARQYANDAAEFAGHAQESARIAGDHLRYAQQSLDYAKAQQARAHQAAAAAESDASQAEANASEATSHAVDARASATAAASSAASARSSAEAAGQDAARAAQAADDAYQAAVAKDLAEQAAVQAAQEAELIDKPTPESDEDLISMLKRVVGPVVIDTILEFLGVNDLRRCFGGSVSSCLMAAINVPGFGKILKAGKLVGAVRQLVGKIGDVRDAFRARRARNAERSQSVKNLPNCPARASASMIWQQGAFSHSSTTRNLLDYGRQEGLGLSRFDFSQRGPARCSIKPTQERPYRGGNFDHLATGKWNDVAHQRHHIISGAVIRNNPGIMPGNLKYGNAPSIQMTKEDHRRTLSHPMYPGNAKYREHQKDLMEKGNYDEAFAEEYRYIQQEFAGKYNTALEEMIDYAAEMGLVTVHPGTGKPLRSQGV
ncbi:hypothetical protein [Corynebacterium kalidii]|uniref:Methyl-accepting transducer domain-containing protein n=1 Tax=Corynebacterium kalidii TaxID=2931982 RepID=A0A9X2AXW0_9CORY|nr:hypothetical protein [Corynebacterium kalidii]MCJ7857456.1 hypothetical protein [Corynebacterium kalidii]